MSGIPIAPLKLRESESRREVWDVLRRKWVVLTPEEHVRQSLVHFLAEFRSFPKGLMSLERGLDYHGLGKRYDLLVYGRDGKPLILCECKAPYVELSDEVVLQVSVYNSQIGAGHLLLCNGRDLLFFSRGEAGFAALESVPEWQALCAED